MFQMVLIDRNIQLNLHDAGFFFFSLDSCMYFLEVSGSLEKWVPGPLLSTLLWTIAKIQRD